MRLGQDEPLGPAPKSGVIAQICPEIAWFGLYLTKIHFQLRMGGVMSVGRGNWVKFPISN